MVLFNHLTKKSRMRPLLCSTNTAIQNKLQLSDFVGLPMHDATLTASTNHRLAGVGVHRTYLPTVYCLQVTICKVALFVSKQGVLPMCRLVRDRRTVWCLTWKQEEKIC